MKTVPLEKAREKLLKELGLEARKRAMERSHSSKISVGSWWPEVELLLNQGYTVDEISLAIGVGKRQVFRIREQGLKGDSFVYRVNDPTPIEKLHPKFQKMLEFNAEGFEAFFKEFSGKELPNHAKDWIREFTENSNLILNVPPRFAKTTIFGVWVPIWLICADRNAEIISVSKTARFAQRQSAEVAYNLKHNRKLVETFGRFAPEAEKSDVAWRPASGDIMVVGRTRFGA